MGPTQVESEWEVVALMDGPGFHCPGVVSDWLEPCGSSRFCFERVDWQTGWVDAAWLVNVIPAPGDGSVLREVDDVECERRVDRNCGLQAAWWLPRAVANASNLRRRTF